jgi:hypothetical protein
MIQQLPKEFKSLCAKISLERTRPAQWVEAHQLRRDALRELATGKPIDEVREWLQGLLVAPFAHKVGGIKSLERPHPRNLALPHADNKTLTGDLSR